MKARLRELLRATPFRPFIIRMAGGREYRVGHPDFVFASPNNQSWILWKNQALTEPINSPGC